MPEKGTEIKVFVRNFLLCKRLEDDKDVDGGVRLVGTIVQSVLNDRGLTQLNGNSGGDANGETTRYFDYRFNDRSYKNDEVLTPRRTELDDGNVWRTTFQANIPLKIEVAAEAFPFKVLKATADIELSSGADGTTRIRPNLVLAKEETRNNVSVNDNMDGMLNYDLLSDYPEVEYRYEKKKGYCPKYSVTFYLTVDGTEKFVRGVAPLVLLAALNTLFLADDLQKSGGDASSGEDDAKKLLGFTSVLALAVVFLFGGVTDPSAPKAKASDILYILFVFVSLILSAVSETLVGGSYAVRIIGVVLFWLSFAFPFSNWARIRMLANGKSPRDEFKKLFVRDTTYQKQEGFSEDFFVRLEPDANFPQKFKVGTAAQFDENIYEVDDPDKEGKNIFIKYPRQ